MIDYLIQYAKDRLARARMCLGEKKIAEMEDQLQLVNMAYRGGEALREAYMNVLAKKGDKNGNV